VASNGTMVRGVNKEVTLLAIKVSGDPNQSTPGRLIAGIVYAARMGADVIETPVGFDIDKRADPGTAIAFELAALYAHFKGALIVGLSFNDGADLDNNGDIVRYPCEAFGVICASATGPTGAPEAPGGLNGPWENVDARATRPDPANPLTGKPYSGFGAAVDVAAPGGSLVTNPNAPPPNLPTFVWLPCTTAATEDSGPSAVINCRPNGLPVLDRVAPGVGTSWAAPHVAGLAALLVAKHGHGRPAFIRSRILQSADDLSGDLGAPVADGRDPYYGYGRINVARALGLVR
jgi:subtilisin family serine protease